MKILYVSQYFPPEMGAPAARAAELAHHWSEAGHAVSVLTGFPNHPTGIVPPEWRDRLRRIVYQERQSGPQPSALSPQPSANSTDAQAPEVQGPRSDVCFDVYRTWLWPLPNRKSHERMRNYASFCISAALRGLAIPRPDVVIASSPQLLVGLSGWWLAFSRQIPFVFEVRDLWPESLMAVGVSNEDSLLHRALAAVAGFLYERADHIVVVSPAFKDRLVKDWRVPAEKISIVENGVETDTFSPRAVAESSLRLELGLEGKFVASYIGTMGNAHGLETLLDAAADLQTRDPQVVFLLIGEGAEKEKIKAQANARGLTNVRFLDQQPRAKIPEYILASNACLVLLKKTDVFKTVIPTKMLEFMSCARPVILGVDGQARQIVEEAGAGIAIEPENAAALASAVTHLRSNEKLAAVMGEKGREYIIEHFSRAQTAKKYIDVLDRLIGDSARPRS